MISICNHLYGSTTYTARARFFYLFVGARTNFSIKCIHLQTFCMCVCVSMMVYIVKHGTTPAQPGIETVAHFQSIDWFHSSCAPHPQMNELLGHYLYHKYVELYNFTVNPTLGHVFHRAFNVKWPFHGWRSCRSALIGLENCPRNCENQPNRGARISRDAQRKVQTRLWRLVCMMGVELDGATFCCRLSSIDFSCPHDRENHPSWCLDGVFLCSICLRLLCGGYKTSRQAAERF